MTEKKEKQAEEEKDLLEFLAADTVAPSTEIGDGTKFVDGDIDQRIQEPGTEKSPGDAVYGGPYLSDIQREEWQKRHGEDTYPPGQEPHFYKKNNKK